VRIKHFNIEIGAQLYMACADASRLRILSLIMRNGKMCVSDLEQILNFTQAKTSRHLAYLRNSGIVTADKYYQWAYYSVKDEVYDVVKQMLQFLQRDATLLRDQEAFQTLFTNRELALAKLKGLKN